MPIPRPALLTRRDIMNKYILAAGVLALVAAMCVPASAVSDSSDAFDTGSAGVSWVSNPLSAEQAQRLYTLDYGTGVAEDSLEFLVEDTYHFDITELALSELKVRLAKGTEVTENSRTEVYDSSFSCKLKFKAAVNAVGYTLLETIGVNPELIEFVSISNETQAGAYFEVDVTYSSVSSNIQTDHVAKNNEGKYVVTGTDVNMCIETGTFVGTVKYCYNDGENDVVKQFSADYSRTIGYKMTRNNTFECDVKEVVAGTPMHATMSLSDVAYKMVKKDTIDGKSYTTTFDVADLLTAELVSGVEVGTASIMEDASFAIPEYTFYGTGTSLFSSVADSDLASNEALKGFMSENGKIGETFASAKSVAEDDAKISGGSNLLLYAGIAAVAVGAAAVVCFLFLRRRA